MLAEEVVSSAREVMRFLGWSVPEPMVEVVARATTRLEVERELPLVSSIVAGYCFCEGLARDKKDRQRTRIETVSLAAGRK